MRDGDLRRIFARYIPEAHWQPVETWSTGQGVPDTEYCLDGRTGWIEFKKIKGKKVALSPFQVAWLLRRVRAGGRCLIAARKEQSLFLYHGCLADQVAAGTAAPLLQCDGGPVAWDWQAIKSLM